MKKKRLRAIIRMVVQSNDTLLAQNARLREGAKERLDMIRELFEAHFGPISPERQLLLRGPDLALWKKAKSLLGIGSPE